MFLQRIRPDQSVGGDVTCLRRVNTLEPGFVLAPEHVAAAGEIDAVPVKYRHSVKITRTFAAVAEVLMNIFLGRGRVEIELENFLQPPDGGVRGPLLVVSCL